MATHSSILAWKILWTEQNNGRQSIGLQRVRHDGVIPTTKTVMHVCLGLYLQEKKNFTFLPSSCLHVIIQHFGPDSLVCFWFFFPVNRFHFFICFLCHVLLLSFSLLLSGLSLTCVYFSAGKQSVIGNHQVLSGAEN